MHDLARTASRMLAKPDGPRVAVFDIEGFDTHASQGGDEGEHADKLADYDLILSRLKQGMGDAFDNTVIVTLTEFGRKLDQNGGNGTEHGYGTAVLLAGGLVKGGMVHADWPGLQKKHLFEGQDLNATMDARSIYCSAMATCFQVDFEQLKRDVFWNELLVDLTDRLFVYCSEYPQHAGGVNGNYSQTVSIDTKVDVDATCGSDDIFSANSVRYLRIFFVRTIEGLI